MKLYRNYPIASDRMGMLWAINGIKDACIIEFGPAGTTHFSIEGLMQFGTIIHAKTFTTHLDEHDVTFGNDERLINALLEVDDVEKPKYIFVLGSSITSIIGIDLEGVINQVQEDMNSQIILLPDCDFQSNFRYGVGVALTALVREITLQMPQQEKEPLFNLLGLGIHDYNHASDYEEIKRLMKDYFALDVGTTFTLGTSIDKIENASKAMINLVVNPEGLEAAKLLKEAYNQPYVDMRPYGLDNTRRWLKHIGHVLNKALPNHMDQEELLKIDYKENMLKRRIKQLDNKLIYVNKATMDTKALEDYLRCLGFQLTENKGAAFIQFTNGIETLRSNRAIQISHPSFYQERQYPYAPMMGIRGTYYLLQEIGNTLTKALLL